MTMRAFRVAVGSPHRRGQVLGTTALAFPEPLCSSTEPQRLLMPQLGPCRKCHRCSWKMPQSRLRRGLLDIPLRDVRLQHDRGHGADALSYHTHQVRPMPGGTGGAAWGLWPLGGCSRGGDGARGSWGAAHSTWFIPAVAEGNKGITRVQCW